MLFYILSSFWAGAVHAATPGHGKTIAAAYIVGARGKPIDALILGIFVTLSHTSEILLVGVLASLGSTWLQPQRIEAHLALVTGLLIVALGFWMLWQQRELLALAMGESGPWARVTTIRMATRRITIANEEGAGWHSHGWGAYHSHRLDLVSDDRPKARSLSR